MELYVFPPSPNCIKVIALAKHLKLPVTQRTVFLPRGEQKAQEFLELNPNGRVPLLVDGPLRLWESDAILHYMADKSHSDLLPRNAIERADMLRWMFWQSAHFAPACGTLIFQRIARPLLGLGEPDAAECARGEENITPLLQILQLHFDDEDYLLGAHLSLADFSLAAFGVYWREAGIPLDRYPAVLAWYERVAALPAWQAALAERALPELATGT